MRYRNIVCIIVTITAFCITGCYSTPVKGKAVSYNFTGNKEKNETASISISYNLPYGGRPFFALITPTLPYLVLDLEGNELPVPAEKKRWEPVIVPAGKKLNIRIIYSFPGLNTGTRVHNNNIRRGIFKCPPLEAGKKYRLWFECSNEEDRKRGGGRLILTYAKVKKLKYGRKPWYEQIHIQEIPPLPL